MNSQAIEDSDVAGIITKFLYGDCDGEGASNVASDDDTGDMRDGELTEEDASAAVAQSAFLAESADTEQCPESTENPESS